jgi:protein HIRA/HIR1
LIKELCGPLYWRPGREERWQPTVLNLTKRDLLKDVLGIFGEFPFARNDACVDSFIVRSKTLARLGQDYQEILKKANEREEN